MTHLVSAIAPRLRETEEVWRNWVAQAEAGAAQGQDSISFSAQASSCVARSPRSDWCPSQALGVFSLQGLSHCPLKSSTAMDFAIGTPESHGEVT
jgi:hypothetical protein